MCETNDKDYKTQGELMLFWQKKKTFEIDRSQC